MLRNAPAWLERGAEFLASTQPGDVIVVCGMPQTGKSRLVKAADGAGVFRRRVTFDAHARRDLRRYEAGLTQSEPWTGIWCTTKELETYPDQLIDWDPCNVVVAPNTEDDAELGAEFTRVGRQLWNTDGIDLIGEEAGIYSRQAVKLMMLISSGGSHAGMRLVLITQSLTRLHLDARRHISHLVVFAQGAKVDLDSLGSYAGDQFVTQVQRLRKGDGPLFWRLGMGSSAGDSNAQKEASA